jgi:hypothetical protein
MHGKPLAFVNGDYAKIGKTYNKHALYENLEDPPQTADAANTGMWYTAGKWTIGDMKNAGQDIGFATTTLPMRTSSPNRAGVVYNPGPFAHEVEWIVYVGDKWERQKEMRVTGILEEDARCVCLQGKHSQEYYLQSRCIENVPGR